MPLRSFLFAPGNHPRRVEKALSLDADAVILDLEDAVAIAEKPATRAAVVAAYARAAHRAALCPGQCRRHRVLLWRPGRDRAARARRHHPAQGRKRRRRSQTIDWLLAQSRTRARPAGRRHRSDPDHRDGARACTQIDAILGAGTRVRHCRVRRRRFHARRQHDLEPRRERAGLCPRARSSPQSAPPASRRRSTRCGSICRTRRGSKPRPGTALGFGFQGKMCIHPNQIAVVNRVFTPSDAEIDFAERVVAAFAEAEAGGQRGDPARRQVHRLPDRLSRAARAATRWRRSARGSADDDATDQTGPLERHHRPRSVQLSRRALRLHAAGRSRRRR